MLIFFLVMLLLFLFFLLWLLPVFYLFLYHSLVGNLILLACVLLISVEHKLKGLFVGACLIGLPYLLHYKVGVGEAFTTQSLQTFLGIQKTTNPHIIFDPTILETQVSQQALDAYNETGQWDWSQETTDLYKQSLHKNPYVRNLDTDAIQYARTIYSEPAIKAVLNYFSLQGLERAEREEKKKQEWESLPSGFGTFAQHLY